MRQLRRKCLGADGREVLVDVAPGEPEELIAARAQEDDVDLLIR